MLAMWLLTVSVAAQNTVTGKLLDAATHNALDFANVSALREGETSPAAGTTTDSEGNWELHGLSNGNYLIRFSFIGYVEKTRTVSLNGKPLSLGKIYLEEDTRQLQEVEVTGQGSTMRFELDKKVFSVDQNIASAGGSASELLENIPSVDVDQEGNISLRNSEAVEIWINGKPAGLTADNRAQVLQQMPAESIESIELITNPSAKYSPEGTAGIINLVLKKDRKAGYYGSVNAGIRYALAAPWTTPPGGHAGFNFNFSKGIVDGWFNVGYHYHTSNGRTVTDRYSYAADTTRLCQNTERHHYGHGLFLRAGIDLRITERSTIGISGFAMPPIGNRTDNPGNYRLSQVNTFVAPQDTANRETLLREYTRNEQGSGSHPGYNAMLDYRVQINPKHHLSLSAAYSQFGFNQDNLYTQTENADTLRQQQINGNTDRMVQLKADYEWKPTMQSRFEAGWQTDLAWRRTNASASNFNNEAARWEALNPYYNDFGNDEQIHALYLTYGNRFWDCFSVQVGLRTEYMRRSLNTQYYNAGNELVTARQDTSYLQWFPSAYLSYSFKNGHELQLNYTRRIDRPRGHQINPRQNFSDSTNIQYGNPALDPQYSSSLELNYLKNWERHTLSAGLFYRLAEHVIQNVKYMDGNVMKNTFMNMNNRHEAGVEIVSKNRFLDNAIILTTSVNAYYNRLDAAEYHSALNGTPVDITLEAQNIFAWSARLNAQFMFTKTFTGQLSARYHSPRAVAQGTSTHNYSIDLGLRKTFLDKKIALAFNVRDILNSRSRSNTTWDKDFWQYQQRRWNSRTISLDFTYNFGNMRSKPPKQMNNNEMSESSSFDEGGEE